jgi:hypothetical protein
VDSTLFVLVLYDCIPKDFNDTAANMLHGSYELKKTTRLNYIPSWQLFESVVRKIAANRMWRWDGGINFEHWAIDGHTALGVI